MKKLAIIWFVLTLNIAGISSAAEIKDLFQRDLPVVSELAPDRSQAMRDGMRDVLIRATGNNHIDEKRLIKTSLKKAEYYVQEYEFLNSDPLNTSQYYIRIHYNASDIIRLLKKAGVNFWGENRPQVLVWLAIKHDNDTEILSANTNNPMINILKTESDTLGLPLIFPVVDAKMKEQLSTNDLLKMSYRSLQDASKSYDAEAYLIGNIEEFNDQQCQSRWQFIYQNTQWGFNIRSNSLDASLKEIISQVTHVLTNQYAATQKSSPIWLNLEVRNILHRADLRRLILTLKKMELVKQIQLEEIIKDKVQLSLLVDGDADAFQANIKTFERLQLKSKRHGNELQYEWVR